MYSKILKQITFWKVVLVAILALGLYSTYVRFFQGLGPSTNLSDEMPWGIWIGFNIFVGIGLAAGGFTIAAAVHVFHLHKYEAISRPVILTAFLGYLSAVTALTFEVGQPWRLWHPLILWNPHSVLFEVAWCVMLYTSVLALEFSPIVFEKFNLRVPLKIVRTIYVPLVIAGVLLSTLHQSSLGTLYVIAPDKLHPLWYSPFLPVFFFISAISGGLALTIFESFLCKRAFGKHLKRELLPGLARVTALILVVYTVWKFVDLQARGALGYVFAITPESVMFWGEIGLGAILPIILFSNRRVRQSNGWLFFSAMLAIMGFIVNRINVAVTGMTGSAGVDYIPSWTEFAITIMAPAASFFLFALAVNFLPVFSTESSIHTTDVQPAPFDEKKKKTIFPAPALIGLWAFLLVGIITVSYALKTKDSSEEATPKLQFDRTVEFSIDELKLPADYAFPPSEDSMGPVTFKHSTHLQSGNIECSNCHESLFKLTRSGEPVTGELTQERVHDGDLCASCHTGEKAFAIDECDSCHQ